ncbi:MAG: hypothetical protein AAGB93_05395 [Planctomycetota bacterium]
MRSAILLSGALLGAAPSLSFPAAPTQETTEVTLPDGRVVTTTLPDGPHRVRAADGTSLVEGEYKGGQRSGRWVYRFADGEKRAIGKYKDGERVGAWTFYGPDGAKRATGKFKKGEPSGPWKLTSSVDGADSRRTGVLERVRWPAPSGAMFAAGHLFDGAPFGPWWIVWPDGSRCLSATLVEGRTAGDITLHLPGGADSQRLLPETDDAPDLPALLFEEPDANGDPTRPPSAGLKAAAESVALARTWPELAIDGQDATFGEHVETYFDPKSPCGDACLIDVVRWALDVVGTPDAKDGAKAPRRAEANAVLIQHLGAPAGKDPEITPEIVLRWQALYLLVKDEPAFWGIDARTQPKLVDQLRFLDASHLLSSRFEPDAAPSRRRATARATDEEKALAEAIAEASAWLAAHQDASGGWAPAKFIEHDPADDRCDGKGISVHDVGVTALGMLALMEAGSNASEGLHQDAVRRGAVHLIGSQDVKKGLFGRPIHHAYLYDHAAATLALARLLSTSPTPRVRRSVEQAVELIESQRADAGGWGYAKGPGKMPDTSMTGWHTRALVAAREVGVPVDASFEEATIRFLDAMTDPANGRVGYNVAGSASARVPGLNDAYPSDQGEALTAVGLTCRFALGDAPDDSGVRAHADLMMQTLPVWNPESFGCDMYYWYYGSLAMRRMGGKYLRTWQAALAPALLDSQRTDGSARGSWDPVGPWGHAGGRVYATALGLLALAPLRP